jgi:hypothetical protein
MRVADPEPVVAVHRDGIEDRKTEIALLDTVLMPLGAVHRFVPLLPFVRRKRGNSFSNCVYRVYRVCSEQCF